MSLHSYSLLRRALAADAIGSGAIALLLSIAAGPLSELLGFAPSFLRTVGLLLLPWTIWVGWLATRTDPPRTQVWSVIGINALWVIDSVVLLLGGWTQPTSLGVAFVIAQAVAVGVFAELQYIGVRRAAFSAA